MRSEEKHEFTIAVGNHHFTVGMKGLTTHFASHAVECSAKGRWCIAQAGPRLVAVQHFQLRVEILKPWDLLEERYAGVTSF
eukprot:11174520-Lingulodinium_polyedra.AAC.1